MVNADREKDAVKNGSLQSYETVKYFGAESYEFERYLKLYASTAIVAIQLSIFCAMNISIQIASYCDMTAYSS
jgi:ABC-type transport system involved in Fe-S cluster assembly fused permease/ATPase subunit